MRGKFHIAIAALLVFPAMAHAVIVDRVAIAVGNKVITQSDIEERIRLTAFQNSVRPDFSLASRREAAQRLIEKKLVEREMDVGRFPPTPPEKGAELLDDYQQSHFPVGKTAMLNALRSAGLTESELEEDLIRQQDDLTFLELRFRPAVLVNDEEVQKYFDEKIPPGPLKNPESLATMRPQIEQLLANQRADADLENWLKDQRNRVKIVYLEKDLMPAGETK